MAKVFIEEAECQKQPTEQACLARYSADNLRLGVLIIRGVAG